MRQTLGILDAGQYATGLGKAIGKIVVEEASGVLSEQVVRAGKRPGGAVASGLLNCQKKEIWRLAREAGPRTHALTALQKVHPREPNL